MESELILTGRPITKKNHQRAFPMAAMFAPAESKTRIHCPKCHTKLRIPFNLKQSEQYDIYETACLWQLKQYRGPKFTGKIILTCVYWMPDRRSEPDLIGLLQATQDILQKAGVIINDKNIAWLGDSHIEGIDKNNPRVEILIESM